MPDINLIDIIDLIERAEASGIKILFIDNEIQLKVSKDKNLSPELINELRSNKNDLIEYFKRYTLTDKRSDNVIVKRESNNHWLPLSFSQERLWFIDRLEGSTQYHIPAVLKIKGKLNKEILAGALSAIVDRHEVLRTVIIEKDGRGFQKILEKGLWRLTLTGSLEKNNNPSALKAYINQKIAEPFDLATDHMLRVELINLAPDEYILVVTLHHIAADGRSISIIVQELLELYESLLTGRKSNLLPVDIQYADYALWQRNYLQGPMLDKQVSYWRQKLSNVTELNLFSDYSRVSAEVPNGASFSFHFDQKLTDRLKVFSNIQGVTLFVTLLSAFKILMFRYSGQEDIIIGSPVSNRRQEEIERMIGFFVNMLALRSVITPDMQYIDFLKQVKETTFEALEHQDIPFEKVVSEVLKVREANMHPLVQIIFSLQNTTDIPAIKLTDVEINEENFLNSTAQFELDFSFVENQNGLNLNINYNKNLYKAETIGAMCRHYEVIIRSAIETPDQKNIDINWLSVSEQRQILNEFNVTSEAIRSVGTLPDLFRARVSSDGEKTALIFGEERLSYGELDARSNQLAHYLVEFCGVSAGDIIGVQLEKSGWLIVAILGILKAGGAYVPIDPDYPSDRISYQLEDSGCKVLIDEERMGAIKGDMASCSCETPDCGITPDDLAYIIYTSGSTGRPKGVMVEHRHAASICQAWIEAYQLESFGVRLLQLASVSFDVFFGDICRSLLSGGTMVLCSNEVKYDFEALYKLIKEHEINILESTPGLILPFVRYIEEQHLDIDFMKVFIIGSDLLSAQAYQDLWDRYGKKFRVINSYGTTETTIDSLYFEGELSPGQLTGSTPIGKPFLNTQAYILSKEGQLQPVGIPGELYIGGSGVSRGYLNRGELTMERFVANPYGPGRLYRTGDLGRWLPDGNIEYLGRMDDQVKIRGYRIELGEIESVLVQHAGISEALVVAREQSSGDKYLAAYYVSSDGRELDSRELKEYLGGQLPGYMVPSAYVWQEQFRLTANGKIDKKSLPEPEVTGSLTGGRYIAPRTEIERALAAVYEEVLGYKPVGIKDDFFELGGDSIKSIQVVSRLRQRGYQLQVRDVLRHPQVGELTGRISRVTRSISQQAVEGVLSLSPIQRSFLGSLQPELHHYNQSVLLYSRERIDGVVLREILGHLAGHHDALRMVYRRDASGDWEQYNEGLPGRYDLQEYDYSGVWEQNEELSGYCGELQSGMELGSGPMLRAGLFHCHDGDRLLLVIHHLVVDGVSWRILFEDLSQLYSQYKSGTPLRLPLKTDSFRYWQQQQELYSQSSALRSEVSYWGWLERQSWPGLPKDYPGGVRGQDQEGQCSFTLDAEQTRLLQTRCHSVYRTEINDLLLTGLGVSLRETFGVDQVLVSLEGHGREEIGGEADVTRTVGWFTTEYPVLLDMSGGEDVESVLVRVKEHLHRVPNKGIGYGILRYMSGSSFRGGQEYKVRPEISFNYLGDFGSGLETGSGERLFEFSGGYQGSTASPLREREESLTVSGIIIEGSLTLSVSYNGGEFAGPTITSLMSSYQATLEELTSMLGADREHHLTPVDLTYQGLSIRDLSLLNRDNDLEDVYPLSPLQEGLYYHWLSDPGSGNYFEQMLYEIGDETLDLDALEKSYAYIVGRHTILRTSFTLEYGEPLQVVRRQVRSGFRYQDVSQEGSFSVSGFSKADRDQGFTLGEGSQMRLTVLRTGAGTYSFVWSHHHILMDGWCVGVIINEFYGAYRSYRSGSAPEPVVPAYPYVNYIKWLGGLDKGSSQRYWQGYLSGYETLTGIPVQGIPGLTPGRHSHQWLVISGSQLQGMRTVCGELGITENTFIQAVWGLLLSRYNNTEDVVFGSVVSGRPGELEGVETMIGLFINTVPVRVRYDHGTGVAELLRGLQAQNIEGLPHHYVQLAEIQSSHELGSGLLDHILVFENYPVQELISGGAAGASDGGLGILSAEVFEQTNYRLTVVIVPSADQIKIDLGYDSGLYQGWFMEQLSGHFSGLVTSVLEDRSGLVGSLAYMDSQEQEKLGGFTGGAEVSQGEETLLDLFRAQVELRGEETAVVFEDSSLTYRELDARSNQLAHYLVRRGVKPGSLVPVCVERSLEMIIGLLGILKSGGAYVPIDPDYPSDRIRYILEDTSAELLLSSGELLGAVSGHRELVLMDRDGSQISKEATTGPGIKIAPGSLAYVIYTSGSTGRPKGVMVEHGNVSGFIQNLSGRFGFRPGMKIGALTTYSFDISVLELLGSLSTGLSVVVLDEADPLKVLSQLEQQGINILQVTPSRLIQLTLTETGLRSLSGLEILLIGGEALPENLYGALREELAGVSIYNVYGPTETTIWSSSLPVHESRCLTIGRPLIDERLYILDRHKKLLPVGVSGEIYIGGSGVSRGYLNRGELTMERFVANPYGPGRLYRTGDLGRWLPDGNIEYLGRMDDQVKIRGYRIELGEIESVLVQHAGISEALVVAREQSSGDKYLAAYYVSSDGRELDSRELKEYLGGQLPGYMVPSAYVWQEQFRLTANGKIDKKSLPEPEVTGSLTGGRYIAPRTEIERALAAVYEEVLGYKPVGIKDDFFELGGDSIKSIQVVSRLRQRGYQLQVRDVLRHPQVGELTGRISRVTRSISQQAVEGVLSLSPIQRSFLGSLQPELHHYNQSVLLYSRERIDGVVLREILGHLAGHHDALRMVYRRDASGDWEQYNEGLPGRYDLQEYDYSGVWEQNEELSGYCGELQSGMELGSGPMLRAGLFHCHDGDRLLLVIHHLVVDGVSWRILFEDLSQLYSQYKSGTPLRLPLKTDSFRYWQQQQELYSQSSALRSEVSYWGWLERQSWPGLPKDYPGGVRGQDQEGQCSFTLDAEQTRLLQTRCHSVYRTEINDLLLTGLGVSLRETFGVDQVLVSLEGHGREEIGGEADVTRTVGWFTTEYPVLLDMSGGEDVESVLVRVKEHLHRVPNKGIGYGILRYMSGSSFRGGQEYKVRPEISFNYLGDFGSGLETGSGERLFEFSGGYQGSTASPLREREESLTVSGIIIEGSLTLSVSYNGGEFAGPTITSLMSSYQATLEELTSMLGADREHHLTPVDLTYQGLSIRDLSLLNRDNDLEDVYPLSPLQEGLYYHWLSDPGSGNYFEQMLYEIGDETLDLDALEKSYAYIVGRHTILRTSFTLEYGEPLQVVRRQVRSGFRYQDVSQEGSFSVSGFSKADRDQGFTLGEGSQMRLTVLRTGAGTYSFVWSHHHILMDGWCVGVIINEFYGAYRSYRSGSAPEPVVPAYPYVNYIKWLGGLDKGSSQRYWQGYLSGYETLTGIPVQGIPGLTPGRHSHQWLVISGSQLQGMRTVCGELGITENTFIQAVWGLLLSRYNNTEDVVFGSVVSGRPGELEGVETMIGLFINTVPVRVRYDHGTGVAELLRGLQAQNIEGLPHHYVQLAEIQSSHELGSGLLDHILVFENYPVQELISGGAAGASDGGLGILSAEVFEQTNYRLTVVIVPSADQIKIDLGYDSGLYQGWFMEQLSGHFSGLVTSVLEDRSGLVGSLAYMDSQEQEKLGGFTGGAEVSQGEETLLDLFRAQVELRGEETAVVFEDSSLTYRELDARSNQLAHYLVRHYGLKKEELAGIKLNRSEWAIIAMLGILKSGGAYVPIDPGYPSDRISYLLEDSNCKIIIDDNELECFKSESDQYSREWIGEANADNLAYVLYTSGSTGYPKGVAIEHKNLLNYLKWANSSYFENKNGFCFAFFTSLSFDLTITSIFSTLLRGDQISVYREDDVSSILSRIFYKDKEVNAAKLTPSHINLLKYLPIGESSIQVVILGGEAVTSEQVSLLKRINRGLKIYNEYGPTETTVGCSSVELKETDKRITIGSPGDNSNIYIANKDIHLMPVGIPGELYIGGAQIARGYLNRGELTMERFVANPYGPGRLYRTGDLGRWLPDGNIEYLGRMDDQVKIRGYRIELGEIESVLVQHAGISEALVVAREQSSGDKYLAAYYVSSDGRELDSRELKEYLGGQLPGYMVPSAYVWQEQFRLTANGKIDKKSLPEPEVTGSLTGGRYIAPRTEIERALAAVYEEVLGYKPVGIKDDFFELGGDSIKSIQVVSRLRQRGYQLQVRDVLRHPQVGELTGRISRVTRSISQQAVEGVLSLSPIQRSFLGSLQPELHHYNQSVLLYSRERIDGVVLREILGHLAGHHDALRMVYRRDASGDWEQYNEGLPGRYDLQEYDYSGVWEQNEELSGYCGELQSGMELGSGPMLRAGLFHCHDGDRLLLVIHHLVVDGVSWRILFEDLSQLYSQYKSGTPLRLPLKTDSFRYWQQQQELYSQSSALRSEVSYWGWLERQSWPGLPKDYPGGVRGQDQEGQCSFTLDAEQTRLLQTRCHSVYRTEINDLLLTGLGVSLRETFGVDQVLVSLEGHGREEIGGEADVTRTVGWFTTEYPVLLDMSGGEDVESVLVRVKEHLHRVPNKGIGYGILRYMSGSSFRGGQEYKVRPEISFNYLGDFGSGLETGSGERLFEFSGGYQGSTASPLREREESLTVSGIIIEGSLTLSVSYNGGEFAGPTITSLMSSYQATLEELTSMLGADREHHLTPVDLTYQGLSIRDLSLLNRDNDLEDVYPLSPLQEGLYYHWLSDPGSGNYFEQMLYEIGDETLDLDALEKSYAYIVGRHTILRTSFTLEYGEPLQVVRRQVRSGFRYQDVSQEGSFSVSGFSKADRDQGFTLGEGSQMRLTVLRTGAGTYSFVWSHHHILMDGWCVGVIINEFYGAYRSYRSGSAPEPVVPAYPYVNYIKWLGGLDKGSSQRYWQGYLSGYETLTGIPVQGIPGLTPGRHSHQWLVISGSQLQGMRTVCGELGITENTFIQAVWGLLLSRYNNTEDVVFGSVVSGRPGELEGVETMIGLFINTVPVRVRYDHGTGVAELLRGLQAQNIEGLPHHYVQLAEIQSSHELGSGLLDHILVFENYPVQELISGGAAGASDGGLGILSAEVFEQTNYRLTVVIVPSADQIKIDLGYDSGLYQGWFMEQLSGHFSGLVTSVLEDRSGLVGSLAYMDSQEQEKLGGFTGGAEVSQGEETLLDLFRAQVELRGEETAVVFEDSSLTYRELDARSNQLAHYLVRRGVKPGSLVPVCVERSLEMIIGLLGILKSGGAYVPIDPDYPSDRIRYILEDTSAELLLSSGELLGAVSGHRELVLMDRDGSQISKEATTGPGIKIAPGSLAYVIYTSGSTGRPKGVMVEHGNVSGFIQNLSGRFGFRPGMKIGALTTYSFDISVLELLGSLSTGLSVVVLDEADPLKVLSQLEQQGINILQVTPSRLIQLTLTETGLRSLSGLEILLIGGEALPENLYGALREELAGVSIYNVYGPTETTIWSSSLPVHESRCLTIGRPLIDERLYILDRHKKLLPVGVSGEIYIGGSGVSRGYLNRGELTMERFVANPYGPGRLYRTGDLGRWLPDGNIEYLGRMDDQVKIRGYRIELGEIESVLQTNDNIKQAAVIALESSDGNKILVGYIIPEGNFNPQQITSDLENVLPGYMIPGIWIELQKLPLNNNGKVDRKALSALEYQPASGKEYVAPENETQEKLAAIWQELLVIKRVGINDDFFQLGGNSLSAVRLISGIKKAFSITIQIQIIFQYKTINMLAEYIEFLSINEDTGPEMEFDVFEI